MLGLHASFVGHRLSRRCTSASLTVWVAWALVATADGAPSSNAGTVALRVAAHTAKVRRWTVIQAEVTNNTGSEVVGRLVARGEATEPVVYSRQLSIPAGSRFRAQLHVRPLRQGVLEAAFCRASDTLARRSLGLSVVSPSTQLLLIVDRRATEIPFLGPSSPDDSLSSEPIQDYCAPKDLPDRWVGYDAFDVVVLHDVVASAMSGQQQRALLDWVRSGGTVVAYVGRYASQYRDPFFEQLLGVRVLDSVAARRASALASPGNEPVRLADQDALIARVAGPGQRGSADADGREATALPLVLEHEIGCGRGVFVALDLSAARELTQPSWRALWQRLLHRKGIRNDWAKLEQEMPRYLEKLSGYRLPSFGLWRGAIGSFLLAVTLTYFIFRRWGRTAWAWIAMAIMALAFAFGAHRTGLCSRGMAAERCAVSVIRTRESARLGRATTFVSVYSPTATDVEIGMDSEFAAVAPLEEQRDVGAPLWRLPVAIAEAPNPVWHVEQSRSMVLRTPDVRPGTLRWCRFDHFVRLPKPFVVETLFHEDDVTGHITGVGPWQPVGFVLTGGTRFCKVSPSESNRLDIGARWETLRDWRYDSFAMQTVRRSMGFYDRWADSVCASVSAMGSRLQQAARFPFRSAVGLSMRNVATFSDGHPADPSISWLLVTTDLGCASVPQLLSVPLEIRTRNITCPSGGKGYSGWDSVAESEWLSWNDAQSVVWGSRLLLSAGLRRDWWRRLRLKLSRIPSDCTRIEATVLDRGKPQWRCETPMHERDRASLTIVAPADRLPPLRTDEGVHYIDLDLRLDLRAKSSTGYPPVMVNAHLDIEIPAKRRSSRARAR